MKTPLQRKLDFNLTPSENVHFWLTLLRAFKQAGFSPFHFSLGWKEQRARQFSMSTWLLPKIWAETVSEHTLSKAVVTHVPSYDINIQICQKSRMFAVFLRSNFSIFLHFPNAKTGGGRQWFLEGFWKGFLIYLKLHYIYSLIFSFIMYH